MIDFYLHTVNVSRAVVTSIVGGPLMIIRGFWQADDLVTYRRTVQEGVDRRRLIDNQG